MTTEFYKAGRFHKGLPYEAYVNQMRQQVEAGDEGLDEKARKDYTYTSLNYHRTKRAHRSYKVSDEVRALIDSVTAPQVWVVITAAWCGDSAQTIPYVAEMVKDNPNIDLRILERDDNLDIMDAYLTNGKRSIPILIAINEDGEELFRWGPRPYQASQVYSESVEEGLPKAEVNQRLHLWYGRNRGKAVEAEIVDRLQASFARAA